MRGEKALRVNAIFVSSGSPPRARGEVNSSPCRASPAGITPACAGRRVCAFSVAVPRGDHPRVRGEKLYFPFLYFVRIGSPPRARGEG